MYRFAAVPFAVLLFASTVVNAQPLPERDSVLPRAGAWGAEVSMGGSGGLSLLRFSSPQSAWLLGGSFALSHSSTSAEAPYFALGSRSYGMIDLRVGRRWWRGARHSRLQPVMGAGLGGGFYGWGDQRTINGGVYGEGGSTYFFTPHLSLGATAELSLRYSRNERDATDLSSAVLTEQWSVYGTLVRVGAAVYF